MGRQVNYSELFYKALCHIKSIRAPHADRIEDRDLKWDIVKEQALFSFGGEDFEKSVFVYRSAKSISISCLKYIIQLLFKKYGYNIESVEIKTPENGLDRIRFIFKECKSKSLLVFKEIEESNFWKVKNKEPDEIRCIMNDADCSSCIYVYLMYDYAYLQLVGYNDDESDPGRGYNCYSLKWLFETFFNAEEYNRFYTAVNEYITEVNMHIGYVTLKTLSPSSLINFRKNVEGIILNYKYETLLSLKKKQYNLSENEYAKLIDCYIKDKTYLTLVGEKDFSESLITAEWLFDSMQKAKAIDLTIIGMGYFKAVEQLLFSLLCLHKNKGLYIRNVPLDDEHIKDKSIDLTLGAMAYFVKEYSEELFRSEISWKTRKYIREYLFEYADLRNGFFHKDNIKEMDRITEIREITYNLFFLLLGSFEISKSNLLTLGMISESDSDYQKLCEYINYHSNKVFFLDLGYKEEQIVISQPDLFSKTVNKKYIQYSGVYFKDLGKGGCVVRFDEQNLPKAIYLGKFMFERNEYISTNPVKVRKVFENGHFLCPTIAEESEVVF